MEGGFERPSLVGDPEGILITLFLGFVPPGEVLLGDETEGILETCGLSVGLCRGETLGDLDFLTVEACLVLPWYQVVNWIVEVCSSSSLLPSTGSGTLVCCFLSSARAARAPSL